MKRSLVLILLAISLCGSNRLVCQIFDSSEKSLHQYCDNFNGIVPANCSSYLNSVIDSSQVNELKIRGCDPEIVLDSAKRFQRNLRVLDISYSGYENLDWFNLKLDKLLIFNASHNELSDMQFIFIYHIPEIVEIDLSHNKIIDLNVKFREITTKLRKAHLSHNNLTFLRLKYFPLDSIEYIDLNSNRIQYIYEIDEREYKNFEKLQLDGNPIQLNNCTLINDMAFAHSRGNSIKFSRFSDDACHGKRVHIVRYNSTKNTSEVILIKPDGTFDIQCRDKCFENMIRNYASRNVFRNGSDAAQNIGSSTSWLDLSGNFIGELSVNAFQEFVHLHGLNLSDTNLVHFDFDMLRSQKETITVVDISNNKLNRVNNTQSLRNYSLRELIMGGNKIENAYEIIRYLSPSIEKLDLCGGNVGKVNDTTFQRLIVLKQLNLSNTNLVLPNSNPFEMLQSLEVLDLSHNNLEDFSFSFLSTTLYKLTELNLIGCKIKDISTVIQCLGPNLSKLDLSDNTIRKIEEQTFQKLDKLTDLKLRNLNLQSFELNVLKFQRDLKFLDICNNKLTTIDLQSFPVNNFNHINLEGNDLTELTNLHQTDALKIQLDVANNQFPCNYLKQLKKDYELCGESWRQKNNRDCRTTTQSINGFLQNVYDSIKFW